jgi:signal transduction histidine kinase/DNA-binding response OmpR family regulator/ligand-binding sensor domain-containing protein
LSSENGLSNRRVFSSAYDDKGYIWFATKTNIDRYDGEKFDSYLLSSNEKIKGVVSNKQNKIFAFTEQKIFVYNDLTDQFDELFSFETRNDLFADATINMVYFDPQNTLFVATNNGVLTENNNRLHSVKELEGKQVHCIVKEKDEVYNFGSTDGLHQLRRRSNGDFEVNQNRAFQVLKNKRIQSLFFDKNTNQLWIGTFSDGIYISLNNSTPKEIFKTTLPVKIITQISNNEIWTGSDGEGVYIFDNTNHRIKRKLAQNDGFEDNIGANGIYHILEAEDKVWISTYTAGVFIVNSKSVVSKQYRHQRNNSNSLIDDHVNVIFEDSEGNLWFGTNKGLSFYNQETRKWKQYFQGKENSVILSVMEDRKGDIWVGGYATVLSKINKRNGKITEIRNVPGSGTTGKSYIYTISEDSDGAFWIGSSVNRLMRYSPDTGNFKIFNVDGVIKILHHNTDMYLATYKGVYIINKETDVIRLLDLKKDKYAEDIISYPFINNIIQDTSNENVIWIGTEGYGLINYNISDQKVTIHSKKTGLSSNYIYGMLYDNTGKLWISTENGLNCLNTKTGSITTYFEFDGLSNNSFNFLSYCRLKSGNLIFGTPMGANEISPGNLAHRESPDFNLRIKGFYLFYEKMNANSVKSPLTKSIDETSEIKLTYNQHTFSLDFINLDIANQGRTLYSWKLDGFEKDWNQPSTEHKAVYTNLPTGEYTFMVKALRIDTNMESEIRTIEIIKQPPFWASIYAKLIYFAFLLWLTYFIIRFWINKVDNRFTQRKIKFFVSLAHEIRTPITLIKAPLNEIDNENLTQEGRSALELARKNTDKLFGMVTQLLDFQKIEAEAMTLLVEETYLNVFIDNILNNFIYLANSKGIDLKKGDIITSDIKVWIDRAKVQIMIENLLTNAIKYTQKGGQIIVRIENSSKLIIRISDNGIGIPSKSQEKLFESFFRADNTSDSYEIGTGIGLMFTKKLVELHKGKISFLSSENVGSTFSIEIPSQKDDYREEELKQLINKELDSDQSDIDHNTAMMQILLVEDNDDLRTYLAKMLRKKYQVFEAANGIEALHLLEKESPELILSDILMPLMNGFELCEKIKSNISTCHIPLILLSSLSDREDVVKGLNLGADDYITKPFDMLILESKINTIFNNRANYRKKYIEKSVSLNESTQLNDLNKTFMKKLVELVEKNITNEEFNIDDLSCEMAMSRSVFFKKVKSLTGQNPKDFIRDIKMNKAADLLRDKKYSISEIAYLIGFPNAKYFSTAFKKYYGISPSTFIEKEKREEGFLDETHNE